VQAEEKGKRTEGSIYCAYSHFSPSSGTFPMRTRLPLLRNVKPWRKQFNTNQCLYFYFNEVPTIDHLQSPKVSEDGVPLSPSPHWLRTAHAAIDLKILASHLINPLILSMVVDFNNLLRALNISLDALDSF